MYKASRVFVTERAKYSSFPVKLVRVIRYPFQDLQKCLDNANRASKIDVLGSGCNFNKVVAGWLAHKYHPELKMSEFVQHWWNFDTIRNKYFDTTRLDEDVEAWGYEYILDDEILHVATTRLVELEHTVGRDLILNEDGWHVIDDISDENISTTKKLQDLSIENLMHFKNHDPQPNDL